MHKENFSETFFFSKFNSYSFMVSSLHTKPSLFIILPCMFIWNLVSFFILIAFLDRSWWLTINIQLLIILSILPIHIFFILENILSLFCFATTDRKQFSSMGTWYGCGAWIQEQRPFSFWHTSLSSTNRSNAWSLAALQSHGDVMPHSFHESYYQTIWCGWIQLLKSGKISKINFHILISFALLIFKIKSRIVSKVTQAFMSTIFV